jgi:hypothetical protein
MRSRFIAMRCRMSVVVVRACASHGRACCLISSSQPAIAATTAASGTSTARCSMAVFDRSLDTRNQGNFFTAKGNAIDDVPVKVPADEKGYYTTIATADHAIECLKDHAANHAAKPFFHYIPFIAPHFPLHALPEDIAKYRDKYLEGWDKMREARFARQKEMGITNTTLVGLGARSRPAVCLSRCDGKTRLRRSQSPLAMERADRRAAPLPGHEDGHPRRDGGSHGSRDRSHPRAAQSDGRF